MCDIDLDQLKKLFAYRPPIDETYRISATQPLVVDFQERKHLFIFSANALVLTVEDIGVLTVGANIFTNISFQQGMRLTPVQTTPVTVFVRATDETVP